MMPGCLVKIALRDSLVYLRPSVGISLQKPDKKGEFRRGEVGFVISSLKRVTVSLLIVTSSGSIGWVYETEVKKI